MVILPGSSGWREESHEEIAAFVKKVIGVSLACFQKEEGYHEQANETAAVEFARAILKRFQVYDHFKQGMVG